MAGEADREIERVAVIGAGTMGAQIASLAALSGREVALYDAVSVAAERGRDRAVREIIPAVEAARMMDGTAADAIERLRIVESLERAVGKADLVIEAVREDLEHEARRLRRPLPPGTAGCDSGDEQFVTPFRAVGGGRRWTGAVAQHALLRAGLGSLDA